jgi:serine protease AprX
MYSSVCMGSWRWPRAITTALVSLVAAALVALAVVSASFGGASTQGVAPLGEGPSPVLANTAERHPAKNVEVIVQLRQGADVTAAKELVSAAGGQVTRELGLINGFGAELKAAQAVSLASAPGVEHVSLNAAVKKAGADFHADDLATAYNGAIYTQKAWDGKYTGKGVGVAVIDTGIAGDLPDFQVSQSDPTSRVIASAVVNPSASSSNDGLGHGTHIAGLIAGNGYNRSNSGSGSTQGKYVGVAPEANLISVKAGDEHGGATVLDVIDGLQFVVDYKNDYNIRVVNLSLRSTEAQSYTTDPLDAAVEAAWFNGITVVVAAGNEGTEANAVSYAPANDPYVITVGGTNDNGTKKVDDDSVASWSSRGVTQDGFLKPDILAPGARLVSTLAPGSDYASLCPECITDGDYFRVGGTSMAAGVVSGVVADIIQAKPTWTPNQIKGTLTKKDRGREIKKVTTAAGVTVSGTQLEQADAASLSPTSIVGRLVAVDKVIGLGKPDPAANTNLTSNTLVDPATGAIDYERASWSRASWSEAADVLRASWSRASWSRASWSRASWSATPESCTDFERASWSRASWSDADIQMAKDECAAIEPTRASWSSTEFARASWSTSFDK